MATLESRPGQFVVAGLAAPVRARHRRGAIRRAAADLTHLVVARESIGQPYDDHAVMEQVGVEGGDGRLLSAMLARSRGEHAAYLADQRVLGPQPAGLVEEITHLRRHVAKARG